MPQTNVLLLGAGQAGLATSYYLTRYGVEHTVLEAHAQVGDQWRRRWEGLHLFSPAAYNSLPGLPFPAPPDALPDRLAAADYLQAYVRRFSLPVRTGVQVNKLAETATGFQAETSAGIFTARQVVVATGAYQTPRIPELAGHLPPNARQLHSSEFQSDRQFPSATRILVVGAGASGVQIARELAAAGHAVTLAGRKVGRLPRRYLGRDIYWWLYATGSMSARVDSPYGRFLRRRPLGGTGDAIVGDDDDLITAEYGIDRRPPLVKVEDSTLYFEDDTTLPCPEVVVWCTGYRNRYDWIDIPQAFDAQGQPRHSRGVVETVRGLYFIGLPFLYRMNSSLMGGVGRDAKFIAKQVRRRERESG